MGAWIKSWVIRVYHFLKNGQEFVKRKRAEEGCPK